MMISNVKGQFAKVTGTSTLLEAGADLRTIQMLLGLRDLEERTIYPHFCGASSTLFPPSPAV